MGKGPPTTTKVSDTCMTHVRQTRHFEITLSAPEGPKDRIRQLISPPSQPKVTPRLQFRWALVASDGIANKWAGTLGLLRREREGTDLGDMIERSHAIANVSVLAYNAPFSSSSRSTALRQSNPPNKGKMINELIITAR